LQAYKQRIGRSFLWAFSFSSDFSADYSVGFTAQQQKDGIEYNHRREPPLRVGCAERFVVHRN
jgi:predicted dithiol-disulfide oxidoreductase (DUF899 family)